MKRDTPDKPDPNPGPVAQSVPQDATLSADKLVALAALARGESYDHPAKAAGVRRETLYRWRKEPDFSTAWQQIRQAMHAEVADGLILGAKVAMRSMIDLATRADDEKIRFQAAQDLLQRLDGATERGEAAAAQQQVATVVIAADDALAELRRRRSEGEER